MTGKCRNPGCQRLATVVVHMPMVGDRELCYHCYQALSGLGMDIRRKGPVPTRGGAA